MTRMLISCKYHEDSQTVELRYTDGTLIDIDCMAVEDEVARNMYERSELDYLLNHDPVGYADLVLNGDIEAYLQNVTDYRPPDEREQLEEAWCCTDVQHHAFSLLRRKIEPEKVCTFNRFTHISFNDCIFVLVVIYLPCV